MFQHATTTHRDRKVTFAFDGPAIDSDDQSENWHERIKVVCAHNVDRKRFEAHVMWCKAADRGGYTMEQSAIFTDPYVLIAQEPVGRFSDNRLNAFVANVQSMCVAAVSDDDNDSVAVELLRKAQSYAAVRN